jgi:dipeptidyl aminopeptidase/acylaminoacyl peptidase
MCRGLLATTVVGLAVTIGMSSACLFAADDVISKRSVRIADESQQAPYLLYVPSGHSGGGKHPLIVYLYGRGGSIKDKEYNLAAPSYAKLRRMAVERGYYIVVPELGTDHWMNDRAQRTLDAIVAHALADNPIDPKRVNLMGTSMGGGSALAYAIHRPDVVRSVCAICPMTDFTQWVAENPNYVGSVTAAYGGTPTQVPNAWAKTSAMRNLDAFKEIPVFLVHGVADTVVPPLQSRQLAESLRARHSRVILREVEGLDHTDEIVEPFQEEILDFFDKATH